MLLSAMLGGCTLAPSAGEKEARTRLAQAGDTLRPAAQRPLLPELRSDSPLAEYVRFAVLNHPQVLGAYHDWRASVSRIAPTRALPDPQFTFEADVTSTLMTFMPGLMFDIMTPGKRRAMGREMTAASDVEYRAFVAVALRTAAEARKAWIDLAYVDEAIRLREASIGSLEQSLEIASADYTTGRGMGTLANQVSIQNNTAKVRTDLATLSDRRTAVRVRFKSALGLTPADPDPAWPLAALVPSVVAGEDELWRRASAANPELARMRAMVEMAIASIEVARKARTPDFTVGGMADLKADPLMVRPTATVTLPIWREKIAANIAAAEARRDASAARVTAELINLSAELAQMLYMVREADRMIAYIDETALPNFEQAIATIEAGYQSGMTSPSMIPETQLMALDMRLERVAAMREREIAATELLLLTASATPDEVPVVAESTLSQR
ncbi:outer membrane efflux protein [Opitutus terrae PB90-1]|uniref:Outer membrane efflux protein n=2 Tax=Opitutus terrae TaxID=107709 RepID=B1ZPY0_OPITP|nr:outer membrane efflux protein [Opitutus terrae PB90-1]